jgi:hypothetical protein
MSQSGHLTQWPPRTTNQSEPQESLSTRTRGKSIAGVHIHLCLPAARSLSAELRVGEHANYFGDDIYTDAWGPARAWWLLDVADTILSPSPTMRHALHSHSFSLRRAMHSWLISRSASVERGVYFAAVEWLEGGSYPQGRA